MPPQNELWRTLAIHIPPFLQYAPPLLSSPLLSSPGHTFTLPVPKFLFASHYFTSPLLIHIFSSLYLAAVMACLQLLKSTPSNSNSKFGCLCVQFSSLQKTRIRLRNLGTANDYRRFRVSCKVEDGGKQSNGEEPPESLFMKELRRRGMTPTSLLEEKNRGLEKEEEIKFREEDGGWSYSRRNGIKTGAEANLTDQREMSMALNSEGLEGLIPRGKLLLTLGGTFFLAFWPLILATVAIFFAVYLYFGTQFIHDGRDGAVAPPPYVDPYVLLEEQRIYKTAPPLN